MNGKKAKALRKLAAHIAGAKGLPLVAYNELGKNQRVIDDGVDAAGLPKKRVVQITGTIAVAADTVRGQYKALKSEVKRAYSRAAP